MKKHTNTVLILTICVALCALTKFGFASIRPYDSMTFKSDTIKLSSGELKWTATEVTNCSTSGCLESNLKALRSYPASSYYLVYKNSKSQWILDKNPDSRIVSNLAVKKFSTLTGHVEILGKDYSDRKRVVILQ